MEDIHVGLEGVSGLPLQILNYSVSNYRGLEHLNIDFSVGFTKPNDRGVTRDNIGHCRCGKSTPEFNTLLYILKRINIVEK